MIDVTSETPTSGDAGEVNLKVSVPGKTEVFENVSIGNVERTVDDPVTGSELVQVEAIPDLPPAPPEPTVEIAKGVSIPLSQFRSAADPQCGFCSAGIQTYLEDGKSKYRPCGCAIRNIRRVLRGQIPTAPFAKVEKDPVLERERIEKRLAPMRAEAARLEAEIAERLKGNEDGIAEAESAVRVSEQLCSASATRVGEEDSLLGVIKRDAAAGICAQEERLAEEREMLAAREKGKALNIGKLQVILAKQHSALENVKGSIKRAENLRRRIALIEARHADVLRSDGDQP